MKKIIILLFFLLFMSYIHAQNINQRNVPAVVLNAFQLKFPNASDVDWELENGNYHIDFVLNDKDNEAVLDYRGKLLKYKQDLYVSEIPKNVLETIKSKVQFFDIKDADLIKENGETVYKINFEIDDRDNDFWIGENGKLLKYIKELKNNEVPENILSAIKNKYGLLDTDHAKYEEEAGKISYYLDGDINDKAHVFTFDKNGDLLKHEQDLKKGEIPAQVMKTITTAYKDYEIRNADLNEENGKTTYKIELKKSKEKILAILNPDGKILEVKD